MKFDKIICKNCKKEEVRCVCEQLKKIKVKLEKQKKKTGWYGTKNFDEHYVPKIYR